MKNQEKQYEVSAHLVAPLSLTQKSNFHILADEKGNSYQFTSIPLGTHYPCTMVLWP